MFSHLVLLKKILLLTWSYCLCVCVCRCVCVFFPSEITLHILLKLQNRNFLERLVSWNDMRFIMTELVAPVWVLRCIKCLTVNIYFLNSICFGLSSFFFWNLGLISLFNLILTRPLMPLVQMLRNFKHATFHMFVCSNVHELFMLMNTDSVDFIFTFANLSTYCYKDRAWCWPFVRFFGVSLSLHSDLLHYSLLQSWLHCFGTDEVVKT